MGIMNLETGFVMVYCHSTRTTVCTDLPTYRERERERKNVKSVGTGL